MKKKKVLVVDDDRVTLRYLKCGLESTGMYEVQEEHRANHACAKAMEYKPDIIVLDICMPEMDGGDVAAQIQNHPRLRAVPILFLSSIISPDEAKEHPLISGGHRFLAKPIKIRDMVQAIETSQTNLNTPVAV